MTTEDDDSLSSIKQGLEMISVQTDIEALTEEDLVPGNEVYERLRQAIADRMLEILSTNRRQLIPLLYRIDVSEAKTRKALHKPNLKQSAIALAEAILERYALKLFHRRRSQ